MSGSRAKALRKRFYEEHGRYPSRTDWGKRTVLSGFSGFFLRLFGIGKKEDIFWHRTNE